MGAIGCRRMSHSMPDAMSTVLGEVAETLRRVDAGQLDALADAVLASRGVFLAGEGRSGLVARCLAMRLMHLGLRAHVVGETATPAFGPGDLLVAVSGSGETSFTRAAATAAGDRGGTIAVVTAAADSPLARLAAIRVLVPGGESAQFGGSLFEQAALLVLDSFSLALQRRLGQSEQHMRARHATLE